MGSNSNLKVLKARTRSKAQRMAQHPHAGILERFGPSAHRFEHDFGIVGVQNAGILRVVALQCDHRGLTILVVRRSDGAQYAARITWPATDADAERAFARTFAALEGRIQHREYVTDNSSSAAARAGADTREIIVSHPGVATIESYYAQASPRLRSVIIEQLATLTEGLSEALLIPVTTAQVEAVIGHHHLVSPEGVTVVLELKAEEGAQDVLHDLWLDAATAPPGAACSYDLSAHVAVPFPCSRNVGKALALQLLLAVRALHAEGIIYRNLNPRLLAVFGSVVLRGGEAVPIVKLLPCVDCKVVAPGHGAAISSSVVAGACYAAPETVPVGASFDGRVDSFSIATLVFVLVTGAATLPANVRFGWPRRFMDDSGEHGLAGRMMLRGEMQVVDALGTHFAAGSPARAWLQAGTETDPTLRATVEELIAHPWLESMRAELPAACEKASVDFDRAGLIGAVEAGVLAAGERARHGPLPLHVGPRLALQRVE